MTAPRTPSPGRLGGGAGGAARLVVAAVVLLWVLEVVDVATGHALDQWGIRPRDLEGLLAVPVAPWLHFGFGHVLANTVPLLVLGVLVAAEGVRRLLVVTAFVVVASGLGVWLLAPATSITAGASGVVFGFATYLIARGFVSRRPAHVVVGVGIAVLWGTTLLVGLIPQAGVSWVGHLFGALGGVLAARHLGLDGRARRRADEPAR